MLAKIIVIIISLLTLTNGLKLKESRGRGGGYRPSIRVTKIRSTRIVRRYTKPRFSTKGRSLKGIHRVDRDLEFDIDLSGVYDKQTDQFFGMAPEELNAITKLSVETQGQSMNTTDI